MAFLPSRPSRRTNRAARLPLAALLTLASALPFVWITLSFAGCSLGNLTPDSCTQNADCVATFGVGSECLNGYCTDAKKCSTDADCTTGTCRGGFCSVGSCEGTSKDGTPCFACSPEKRDEFLNACTNASCIKFDPARVTKLPAGGELPPVP